MGVVFALTIALASEKVSVPAVGTSSSVAEAVPQAPWAPPVGASEAVACCAVELGVPWLRVRGHMRRLFLAADSDPGRGDGATSVTPATPARRIAEAVFDAITDDPMISAGGLRRILGIHEESSAGSAGDIAGPGTQAVGCLVGAVALKLLWCLAAQNATTSWASKRCDVKDLDGDVLVSTGAIDPGNLGGRIRGPWPIHALLAMLVEHVQEDGDERPLGRGQAAAAAGAATSAPFRDHGRDDLGRHLHVALRDAPQLGAEAAETALAVLSSASMTPACGEDGGRRGELGPIDEAVWCPYRPPLDAVLCARSQDTRAIQWATHPSKCVDVAGGNTSNRNTLQIWDCAKGRGHPNQRFLSPPGGRGTIRWATHPNKCLDVKAGAVKNKNLIQLFDCAKSGAHANQQFIVPLSLEGQIRWATHPHMCLDVRAGDPENGNVLQLFQCAKDGHANQEFRVPSPSQGESTVRCEVGAEPRQGALAVAAALAVLAARGSPAPMVGNASAAASCNGLQRVCGRASRASAGDDDLWREVGGAVKAAIHGTSSGTPLVHVLADSPWPVAQTLRLAAAQAQRHSESFAAAAHPANPQRAHVCACDMGAWSARDAWATAAAVRVLRDFVKASGDAGQLFELARSGDAARTCSESWEQRLTDATSLVGHVWGLAPTDEIRGFRPLDLELLDSDAEKFGALSRVAKHLLQAGPQDWDAGVCLPGVITVGLVCSTRHLALNQLDQYHVTVAMLGPLLHATTGCLEVVQRRFVEDWSVLVPWVQAPSSFFREIHGPLVHSDHWWRKTSRFAFNGTRHFSDRGAQGGNGPITGASACSGVWDAGEDHPCHQAPRASNAHSAAIGVPATRLLGVGPMKAGSTLVWQVLGAATQLSMGLDCEASTSSPIAQRVSRREAPLELLTTLCYEELFRWELAKDPLVTPAAHRLAEVWPSLSAHGGNLKLYFVVRNPLDCTRSLLQHMRVRTRVASAEEQRFFWGADRFPAHFTLGKQVYFDVSTSGLNYTGYVDAAVQRWGLVVDEYLLCPRRFALVRYEDFVVDPVGGTRRILDALGLSALWLPGAEERATQAAAVQYQTSSGRGRKRDFAKVYGEAMLARMRVAVKTRADLLGYDDLRWGSQGNPGDFDGGSSAGASAGGAGPEAWPPIDMPALPEIRC